MKHTHNSTQATPSTIEPWLTDESKNLYEAYTQQYSSNPFDNRTMESGNLLLDKMTEEKKDTWEEVITSTNMTHNSRKEH